MVVNLAKFHHQEDLYSSTPLTEKNREGHIQKIKIFISNRREIVRSASMFMYRMANQTTSYGIKMTKTSLAS